LSKLKIFAAFAASHSQRYAVEDSLTS